MDFDEYASDYDVALARGLSISGEGKDYFARERISWLARRLRELGLRPKAVLDFGCGTGSAIPFLRKFFAPESILAVDDSVRSLEVAREIHAGSSARFIRMAEHEPDGSIDLAFCNGVFHHIPPGERGAAIETVRRSLRPGGLFALWENNPWNPGTRYVMWRIPFDRDAVPLSSREAQRLLSQAGFEILRTDFLFIFPRALAWLRPLEPRLSRFPLGTQYQVLCRVPEP